MSNDQNGTKYSSDKSKMDHSEQYPTDNDGLFDQFESQQTIDPISIEDLKQKLHEENKSIKLKMILQVRESISNQFEMPDPKQLRSGISSRSCFLVIKV